MYIIIIYFLYKLLFSKWLSYQCYMFGVATCYIYHTEELPVVGERIDCTVCSCLYEKKMFLCDYQQ